MIIYVLVYWFTWLLTIGWLIAENKKKWPSIDQRAQAGESAAYCTVFSLLGPVFIIMVFCMTGFAQHGWSLSFRKEENEEH